MQPLQQFRPPNSHVPFFTHQGQRLPQHYMMQNGFPKRGMGRMLGGTGVPQQSASRGGGILSRLFTNGANHSFGNFPAPSSMHGAQIPGGSGGVLSKLLGGGSIGSSGGGAGLMGTLNNVQHVLRLAQTVGPMIQQYGPMIKNLPALIQMFKALNAVESTKDDDENKNEEGVKTDNDGTSKMTDQAASASGEEEEGKTPSENTDKSDDDTNQTSDTTKNRNRSDDTIGENRKHHHAKGQSIPKLFI